MGREATDATEVEVLFEKIAENKTKVSIEHRHWEKWGEEARDLRDNYDKGWEFVVGECFVKYASGEK